MTNSEKVSTNFATLIAAAAGIFHIASESNLRQNPDAVSNGLRNAADALTHAADNLERQTIEDDPISTASRLSGFGLSKVIDSLSVADPKFTPEEILSATTDALVKGAISLDHESGVHGVSVVTPFGSYNYEGEEPADVVILLNSTATRSIDTKVLIAINSNIDVSQLTVSKHVLIFGGKVLADRSSLANGFVAADKLDLGDCQMNNVQFCTPTAVRIDGRPIKRAAYDIGLVQLAYRAFADKLCEAISDYDPAKAKFGKQENSLAKIKDLTITPFGLLEENDIDTGDEAASSNSRTSHTDLSEDARPLLDSEWETIGKMTNKRLSVIVAGFLSHAHTGETKKELIAQLKALAITVPATNEVLRQELEHADAVDDAVVAEAVAAITLES